MTNDDDAARGSHSPRSYLAVIAAVAVALRSQSRHQRVAASSYSSYVAGDQVVFPPRPRPWQGLIDQVIGSLASGPVSAHWHPVQLRGMTAAWVGVHAPLLGEIGRPWAWDVVTTDDRDRMPELRTDPLALAVDQDLVVVALRNDDDPEVSIRLQVAVHAVPDRVDVPASAMPEPPWRLELATGWSTSAIGASLARWLVERVGPDAALFPPIAATTELAEERFEVGDDLWASASAFDTLLDRDPREAGMITGCLGAVAEALEPWRARAA